MICMSTHMIGILLIIIVYKEGAVD